MRLESVRIELFRNVVNSGDIAIDPDVTCLVGKNESGKTALLNAIYRLNPVREGVSFDSSKDYPRWRVSKDRRAGSIDEATPISAIFAIEDADVQAVEEIFGPGVLISDKLTVTRPYAGGAQLSLSCDVGRALHNLYEDLETPSDLQEALSVKGMGDLKNAIAELDLTEDSGWTEADAATLAKEAVARLKSTNTRNAVGNVLFGRLPKFFYFSDYQSLPGRIDIAELQGQDVPGDSPIQTARALLKLASTEASSLTDEDFEDRKAELEAVSNELTDQVFEYWKQNEDLSVVIDLDKETVQSGYNGQTAVAKYLDVRVRDARHGFTNNFEQRSSGFKWFFSFLTAFSEFEDYEHGVVVLLDEPALTLHGRAQADFLRYIDERLSKSAQVIFTTHSPFMVNPGKLDRVRIVEDRGPKQGSVVSSEAMAVGDDSLFPLQAALGYDIAQNLFVGPDNLIVEGTSDYTYLWLLTERLEELGREGLNERWRVLPAGGAANIPSFVALIGQGLDVTTLVDGGPSAQTKLLNLAQRGLLSNKRLFVTDQFTEGVSPSDIEDLFDPKDYLKLYNEAFGGEKRTLTNTPGKDKIVARISRATGSQFSDHGRPADYLLRNKFDYLPKLSETTLDRFERLFREINKTLS
jgi:predicted ATP-dependent endonuclease of OLD family